MQSELLHCLSAKEWEAFIGSIINKALSKRSLHRIRKERLIADLYSEGWVGILTARKKFDPAMGIKFQTYAHAYARGYIFLRKELKQQRGKKGASRTNWDITLENIESLQDNFIDQETNCGDFLDKNFSDHTTKSVMKDYFVNGKDLREIGYSHNISHEWARKIIERGCNRLKEKYKDEDNIAN